MKLALASLLSTVALATPALADTISGEPNDYGKVTHIRKGVKELDLGGMFVLSHNQSGDGEGTTQVSSLGSVGFQYFLSDNVSAGASFLASYDRLASGADARNFGGALHGTLHVRLGLGAFFRPTIGAGFLAGEQDTEVVPGMVVRSSRVAGLVRLAMPIAYFTSKRFLLQAGPELNILVGSATPEGGMAESETFTSVAGGFGVSVGYAF